MVNKEAFHTRSRANEGVRVDLTLNREVVGWVRVRGRYSDAYRRASAVRERRQWLEIDIPKNDDDTRAKLAVEADAERAASLVIAWSFAEPCTRAAVVAWLLESPQVVDAIETEAAVNEYFLGRRSSDSASGPDESSTS